MRICNRKYIIYIILSFGLLFSCNKRPEGVLSEDKMIDLMVDIQLAEAYYHTSGGPTERIPREVLIESVLAKHGVTHEELDSTVSYYGKNMDEYYSMYEKVEKRLKARNKGLKDEEEKTENDIWPYNRFTAFFPNQTNEGLLFSIPGDMIEKGSALEWKMRLSSMEGTEILLGVEYEDGSATLNKRSAAGSTALQIDLQTDTALTAKRIFGFVSVSENSRPLWADSIRLIKTEFDSMAYSNIRIQTRIGKPIKKPESVIKDMEGSVVSDTVNRDLLL